MDNNLEISKHKEPKVTVLMPVFNGERYLGEAIRSILDQTFTDFEFLIMNDGSTDSSVDIIESFSDARIRLIHNDTNRGLIATLNKGLDLARGEYVARMDCDDLSLPQRLKKQVTFMENHPEVGICGTWYKEFGGKLGRVTRCAPDHESIACGTLFNPVVGHPSIIIRKSYLECYGLRYDPEFNHAEDYELWSRSLKYFKFANISEVLMSYRVHDGQITQYRFSQQMETAGKVRLRLLRELGIEPNDEEFQVHQALSALGRLYVTSFNRDLPSVQLGKVDQWLCKLKKANDIVQVYPEPLFSRMLVERWLGVCFLNYAFNGTWCGSLLCEPQIMKLVDGGRKYALRFILQRLRFCVRDFPGAATQFWKGSVVPTR